MQCVKANLTIFMVQCPFFSVLRNTNFQTASETISQLFVRVQSVNPQWHVIGEKQLALEKDWNTYQFQFTASETDDRVELWLAHFEVDGVYEFRRVSLREVLSDIDAK